MCLTALLMEPSATRSFYQAEITEVRSRSRTSILVHEFEGRRWLVSELWLLRLGWICVSKLHNFIRTIFALMFPLLDIQDESEPKEAQNHSESGK